MNERDLINAAVLVKGSERYVFLYDDRHLADAIQVAAQWASNERLSFTWYDAARIAHKIRQAGKQRIDELEARQ